MQYCLQAFYRIIRFSAILKGALKSLSCVRLFAILWTVACHSLSMGFSREEYWSGLSLAPLGDLSDPGVEAVSLASPALAGGFFTTSAAIAILNTKVIKGRKKERVAISGVLSWTFGIKGSLIHSGPECPTAASSDPSHQERQPSPSMKCSSGCGRAAG